jgi:hypothetical protein
MSSEERVMTALLLFVFLMGVYFLFGLTPLDLLQSLIGIAKEVASLL